MCMFRYRLEAAEAREKNMKHAASSVGLFGKEVSCNRNNQSLRELKDLERRRKTGSAPSPFETPRVPFIRTLAPDAQSGQRRD